MKNMKELSNRLPTYESTRLLNRACIKSISLRLRKGFLL
jgi:hypothetical protein